MSEVTAAVDKPRIKFEVPDWELITESGYLCADMHIHTDCSDSYSSITRLLEIARLRNVGMAVTDHNLISSLEAIDIEKEDVFIIPGMEVSTSDGPHILTYFYEMSELRDFWQENIRPRLQSCPWLALKDCTTEQLMDLLEGRECVVSGAHPMGYLGSNKGVEVCKRKGYIPADVIKRLDAYEVICGGMTRQDNVEAVMSFKGYGLGITGGSDGHIAEDLGSVVTISKADDTEDFLNNILKGENAVRGTEKDFHRRALTGLTSFYNFLDYTPSVIRVQSHQMAMTIKRGTKRKMDRSNRTG
ncbi:MAG: PHP domain-containing protein [Candidatus Methanoplasma sp.]|nr:PHP domain-containing protein [Candidatus Methanoplasma sp.]